VFGCDTLVTVHCIGIKYYKIVYPEKYVAYCRKESAASL
jgi:hypothetical protein